MTSPTCIREIEAECDIDIAGRLMEAIETPRGTRVEIPAPAPECPETRSRRRVERNWRSSLSDEPSPCWSAPSPAPGQAFPDAAAGAAVDRLALTVFLAAVVHALLILGVTFGPEEQERAEQTQHRRRPGAGARSPSAPREARYFAEAHQLGEDIPPPEQPRLAQPAPHPDPESGALGAPGDGAAAGRYPRGRRRRKRSPPPRIAPPSPALPRPRCEGITSCPTRSRSRTRKWGPHTAGPVVLAPGEEAGAEPGSAARRRARAMEELSAEIARRLEAFRERPRREWTATRARAHAHCLLRGGVAPEGGAHRQPPLPEEARRLGLSGSLSLDVALNADGTVAEIVLRRSSGERVLDEAAARIVRLAAPFAEFPPAMRDEVDVLHIERTLAVSRPETGSAAAEAHTLWPRPTPLRIIRSMNLTNQFLIAMPTLAESELPSDGDLHVRAQR